MFPELDKVDKRVREAIHNEYNAQIIDNDIFIKVSFIRITVHLHLLLNLTQFYISMKEEIKNGLKLILRFRPVHIIQFGG